MNSTGAQTQASSWRHGPIWTYSVALFCSALALLVSFIISVDTLQLARQPGSKLSCDINSTLSCSDVAQSWQAELIHIGSSSIPNAFFGIAAQSVFITICVLAISKVRLPSWFAILTWWGSAAALLYSYWLFWQSLFVIKALCPWCLVLVFATTIQFFALSHASVTVQALPSSEGAWASLTLKLRSYYLHKVDLLVETVWIFALVVLILAVDGSAFF